MLITLKELLNPYIEKDAVIGAFNATVYSDAQPIITAAEKSNAPVIIQVGAMATRHMDIGLWGKLLVEMANRATVPVCVHLDHGKKLNEIEAAIEAGFSGVMIDGSQLPYNDNVTLTCEVVRRAAAKGVSVEAEIGSVAYSGMDGIKSVLSDPETTANFVADTGIDAVAVSVGTLHRMQKQASHIDFNLLHEIEKRVRIPLVIHGSSGLLDEELVKLRATRVCKVNVGTALRIAFNDALRKELAENPNNYVYTELFDKPMKAVEDVVIKKLKLMGF
jgi:fructose-bisphosphate aldolase class II